MTRSHGRSSAELRPVEIEADPAPYAEGSCVISMGQTRVLCTATVEKGVPPWRESSGAGWVTAEYGMLPRATHSRNRRERNGPRGRTQEIQRLIGRSLRSVTDLDALGPRTVTLDCDVLQADGGTRTASITGACIALHNALGSLVGEGVLDRNPVRELVSAVSVGIVAGEVVLDLGLWRRLDRSSGHERGGDGERRNHRGAGHSGGRPVRATSTRRAPRPGLERHGPTGSRTETVS